MRKWDDRTIKISKNEVFYNFGRGIEIIQDDIAINCSPQPENSVFVSLAKIISSDAPESIYISPVGCHGIARRKKERNLSMNQRLEEVLSGISSQMPPEEIEKKSLVQNRGRHSHIFIAS